MTQEALSRFSEKRNFIRCRKLLFPVHLPSKGHWTLLAIEMCEGRVTGVSYWDSYFKSGAGEEA